ncbi:hypothetical protein C5167_042656 [Papaver somniferum]|uniref:Uncharacterized protein n=1 Tax=Papaver somniferum TaxID=3469 RepID=A0A4Y7L4G6_PAPSO|nr:hypothetical protein C5167_042656 [Papaver somniferum]
MDVSKKHLNLELEFGLHYSELVNHRGIEYGQKAAEKLFLFCWNLIILHPIVRNSKKENGLRKFPGCSWIEVNAKLNLFVAGDKLHIGAGEVRALLLWFGSIASFYPDEVDIFRGNSRNMTTKEDSFQAILPDYFLDAEYAFEGNKDMTTIPDEEATSGGNSRDITSEQEIFQVPLQIPSDDEYASSISYYNSEEEYSDEDEDEDVDVDVCGGRGLP